MNQEKVDLLINYVMRDIANMVHLTVIDGDISEKALGIREGAAAILSKIEMSGILGDMNLTEEDREFFIVTIGETVLNTVKAVI